MDCASWSETEPAGRDRQYGPPVNPTSPFESRATPGCCCATWICREQTDSVNRTTLGNHDHDKYRHLVWDLGVKPLVARQGTEHGSDLGTQRWFIELAFAHLRWFRLLRIRWKMRDGANRPAATGGGWSFRPREHRSVRRGGTRLKRAPDRTRASTGTPSRPAANAGLLGYQSIDHPGRYALRSRSTGSEHCSMQDPTGPYSHRCTVYLTYTRSAAGGQQSPRSGCGHRRFRHCHQTVPARRGGRPGGTTQGAGKPRSWSSDCWSEASASCNCAHHGQVSTSSTRRAVPSASARSTSRAGLRPGSKASMSGQPLHPAPGNGSARRGSCTATHSPRHTPMTRTSPRRHTQQPLADRPHGPAHAARLSARGPHAPFHLNEPYSFPARGRVTSGFPGRHRALRDHTAGVVGQNRPAFPDHVAAHPLALGQHALCATVDRRAVSDRVASPVVQGDGPPPRSGSNHSPRRMA